MLCKLSLGGVTHALCKQFNQLSGCSKSRGQLSETLNGDATTYQYNGKNQLISTDKAGITTTYTYKPNGIRNGKTEGSVTTRFIVDENRDYAQVLEEITNGTITTTYSYGHDLISQERNGSTSFYHYDGLGSTRALSDAAGTLTDTYDYEAFGELLNHTGSTENSYLFTGEQFDAGLNQYYLRARYYNQQVGRFTQMDTWMGNNYDPITLHKYAYGNADPVTYVDPTGNFGLGSFGASFSIQGVLATANVASTAYSFIDLALSGETPTASQIGTEILLSMLGGSAGKLLKMLPKKTQDKLSNAFDGVSCFFNSFPAGTLVHTLDGLVPIEEIEIGDLVLAFNEETNELSYEEVTHLIQDDQAYNFVNLQLENGEIIEATPQHLFYESYMWKPADEIAAQDQLKVIDGSLVVMSIFRDVRKNRVFNLTVNNAHTFFVGLEGALVHNENKQKGCKFRGQKAKGFDWDHIFDRHSATGNVAKQRTRTTGNTVFPANLSEKQIKARVQGAWKNRELRRSQVDPTTGETRLFYEGIDEKSGETIGFWFNSKTGIVESAFPR